MGSIRKREDTGLLFLDFYFKGTRCREQTALEDNAANRKKVQKVLDRIEAEIAAGTFDYKKFFPGSKQAAKFDVQPEKQSNLVVLNPEYQPTSSALTGVGGTPLLKLWIPGSFQSGGIRRSAESLRQTYLHTVLSSAKYRHGARKQCCPIVVSTK